MTENLILGAILRFGQALAQASPTIIIGFVIAGVFRRLLGYSGTRAIFGNNSWKSLPTAWLLGMLLPVCSLGVIPILREMKKAGVSGGAIIAFGLTAPLFNPISVLYGLTLSNPIVIITFSLCSLTIVSLIGMTWDRLLPSTGDLPEDTAPVSHGLKRMISIMTFGAKEIIGPSSLYILIGLIGVAFLSMVLPPTYLQTAAEHNDPFAPLFMSVIAVPAYATPMTAMVQLAAMFAHGNSIGAAFTLLVLGAGVNLGFVFWVYMQYGWKNSTIWLALFFFVVVLFGYGVDKPLFPEGVDVEGHTHAFDVYCTPFHATTKNAWTKVVTKLSEDTAPHELIAIYGLAFLAVIGAIVKFYDRDEKLEAWYSQATEIETKSYDVELSGTVMGIVALVGLVSFSIFGCYVYYPPPSDILEEMRIVNTEVASSATSQDWETALYWIPVYDDWTRKLQVSRYLRGYKTTDFQRAKADTLRKKLDELKHLAEGKHEEEAKQMGIDISNAYLRLKKSYIEN